MHALSRPNDQRRTPYDMFLFGMVTNGPRGLSQLLTPMEENVEDLDMYGIDWEDLENPELIENFLERSADEDEHDEGVNDLEGLHLPAHMANVVCNPPFCPLSDDQIDILFQQLSTQVDVQSRDMLVQRGVWIQALDILNGLL